MIIMLHFNVAVSAKFERIALNFAGIDLAKFDVDLVVVLTAWIGHLFVFFMARSRSGAATT